MFGQLYARFRDWLNDRLVRLSPAWHRYTAQLSWHKKSAAMRSDTSASAFNAQPKLIYIHVPKTAGKSFMRLCEQNYPGQTSIRDDDRYNAQEWNRARVVGGHFFFDGFDTASAPHLFVAVVRDPVERALPRFRWYQQREKKRELREQRGFDHESMQRTIQQSYYRFQFTWNTQCRYIAGASTFDEARQVLESNPFIVGHFGKLEAWKDTLVEKLQWPVHELPTRNKIAESAPVTDDSELLALLRRENSEDQKLYDWISEQDVFCSVPKDFDYTLLRPHGSA